MIERLRAQEEARIVEIVVSGGDVERVAEANSRRLLDTASALSDVLQDFQPLTTRAMPTVCGESLYTKIGVWR